LEDQIPFDPEWHSGMKIDASIENTSGAFQNPMTASNPKFRPRDKPRPPVPPAIRNDIRFKDWLRWQWQILSQN
jgi:hypothetical protein